ncbi:hypothetical protein [Enteractinococcus helveticum]|uniref:Uncharacterized protein n=1 Tax=Enteractinococcus helveticum TaxID=1837282 RepID=A0A1B7LYI8_9MICC|nr:hypothetical protein [Enteractinococcus helveticum]OAV60469.1 hypothetical protein A6F49_10865 [Enteractinococcus helveticum]
MQDLFTVVMFLIAATLAVLAVMRMSGITRRYACENRPVPKYNRQYMTVMSIGAVGFVLVAIYVAWTH